jgi:two-component system, NarL family, sensor histidine kinase DevS
VSFLPTVDNIEDAARLRDLVDAVLQINSDLSLPDMLERIVRAGVNLIGAKYGALGVLSEDGASLSEFVFVGLGQEVANEIKEFPQGRGILGLLIRDPRPVRIENLTSHRDSFGFPPGHPPMKSFLGVPIMTRGEVFGNLYLTEKTHAKEFTAEDAALAVALANAAAVAIENARLHGRVKDLALAAERERIAADLHDTVIQRLFAIGLGLEASRPLTSNEAAKRRIDEAVDSLDDTVRQIRSTIFALARRNRERGLRDEVSAIVTEAATGLGCEPFLHLDGPIDSEIDDEAAEEVTCVVREALANVVRHSRATRVEVDLVVKNHQLRVEVSDDGIGMPPIHHAGRGLTSMAKRSQDLGGSMSVSPGAHGRGTVLAWRIPLEGTSRAPS